MRNIIFVLMFFVSTYKAFGADAEAVVKCTNPDSIVRIENGFLTILTEKQPEELYVRFALEDLNIAEKLIKVMPSKEIGKSSETVFMVETSITRKDGKPIPEAYQRSVVKNGSLSDYFLCELSVDWK